MTKRQEPSDGSTATRFKSGQSGNPKGRPRNLRLSRSLGQGLDEKALDAVSQWLFWPGTKNGRPVTVSALIEVTFHLL